MSEVYTLVAALVVMSLTDVIKKVVAWIGKLIPKLPTWVKRLKSLWTLIAAILVTYVVYQLSTRFQVELTHPLFVLIVAQLAHEIKDIYAKRNVEVS